MEAELYAEKHNMGFYEISPLVNFNITESFQVSGEPEAEILAICSLNTKDYLGT